MPVLAVRPQSSRHASRDDSARWSRQEELETPQALHRVQQNVLHRTVPYSSTFPIANQQAVADALPAVAATNVPKFYNVSDNTVVYQRVILVHGGAGRQNNTYDGSITVHHHLQEFPPVTFPLANGYFKALVHLAPGPNQLRFTYNLPSNVIPGPSSSTITVNYIPLLQNEPLHLAILVAKDSNLTFDSPPDKTATNGNRLESAIRKLRMAGYLWQAFMGEQMSRNGMGKRTFRLDEEWASDSLSRHDSKYRMTAKVHIIRCDKTMRGQLIESQMLLIISNRY